AARVIPEMMVRIDDRQIGIEDLLGQLAKPIGVRQRAGIGAGFASGVGGHGILPRGRLTIAPTTGGTVWQIYPEINRPQKSNAIGIPLPIPAGGCDRRTAPGSGDA